jgi:ferredoxin-type protein NapH
MKRLFVLLLRVKRWPVQLVSALLMNSYVFANTLKAIPCWGMNCYACPVAAFSCPIGTLQHFVIIRQVPFYLLGVLGLAGALGGRWSCGWFCPFGFLQDLMYKIPVPKWRTSAKGAIKWLRYGFLIILAIIIPFLTLEPWFSKLCPVGTLQGGIPQVILRPELRELIGPFYWLKIGILIAFLAWMTVTKRPFCRYVCPLGAVWSPFNRLSALRLHVDQQACIECSRCKEVCPVDIAVHEDDNAPECIRCLACIGACPTTAISLARPGQAPDLVFTPESEELVA